MKMDGQDESSNVEDARNSGGGGGGGGGFNIGGRGIGVGTIAVALVAGWVFGINPLTVLGLLSGGGSGQTTQSAPGPVAKPPADDTQARFVSQVLRSSSTNRRSAVRPIRWTSGTPIWAAPRRWMPA